MLPSVGYLRLPQIIGNAKKGIPALIPVSAATWWRGVESGRYPQGVKIGPRCTAWHVDSICELIEGMGK